MNSDTAAALRQTAYNLRDEAKRADRKAQALREEALAFEGSAKGYLEAAAVIEWALIEDGEDPA